MGAIQIDHLTKRFGATLAVDSAGTTITLRTLLGLVRPTSGVAAFAGVPYAELEQPARHVGAVLEVTYFRPARRARDHLRMPASAARVPLADPAPGASNPWVAIALLAGTTALLATAPFRTLDIT